MNTNQIKNILLLVPRDKLGGAEQYLKMISDYFLENTSCKVHVIFLKQRKTGDWDNNNPNINLFYGPNDKERNGIFFAIKKLYQLRKVKFDITYTSHIHTNSFIGLLNRFKFYNSKYCVGRESTTVFTRYNGFKLKFIKSLYKIGYSGLNLLICQSEAMKNQLLNGLRSINRRTNVQVIPNPIDLEKIKIQSKEIIDFNFSKKYIVSAGRLINEKGYDILIHSFSDIKKLFPDLNLVILGEGHLKNELLELTEILNLKNDVIFTGQVKNVYPYFKNATACVVSSRIEGFPNVLLQMMSQNNNVASTLCAGGISEISGIHTSPANDQEGLTTAIKNALTKDNSNSRDLFDEELNSRSIVNFIKKKLDKLN